MNFHGWIALPLETKAREIGISVSADSIECGQFIEVMFQILDSKKISYEKFKKNVCLIRTYQLQAFLKKNHLIYMTTLNH